MDEASARETLDRLIRERGSTYGAVSALLRKNPAYIQQYIKRGTPRKIDEEDRRTLARFFGVDEQLLGGPEEGPPVRRTAMRPRNNPIVLVPRLSLGASAGAGTLDEDEAAADAFGFNERWLRDLGGRPDSLSIIRVDGESMAPTLDHGDDIMVDRSDGAGRLRDGIYVLRLDDMLMVKRVATTLRRGCFSIRSDNPAYPSWEDIDPATVAIVGRVIWAGRKIG